MFRSLSLHRRNRNWRGLSHTLDPDRLPCVIDLAPSGCAFWLIVGAGLAWTLLSFSLIGDLDLALTPLDLIPLPFLAIGPVTLALGLVGLFERRRATFGRDGVEVTGRSLGGREGWSLPYGAFRGVLHRVHVVRNKSSSTTWQIVELVHDDPERTLPLSVEASTEEPRGLWERYARVFDRPALEQDDGRLVERAVADLDKPVRTLADEGKVEHRFDPAVPPPKGVSVAREAGAGSQHGEHLRVIITAGRVPLWLVWLFAGPAAIVFLAAVAMGESPGVAAVAVVFLVAVVLVHHFDRRNQRQLLISRKAVTLIDAWQGTGPGGKTLKHEEIEGITIGRVRPGYPGQLVIAGDRGHLKLSGGLSRAAVDWLRDYVTAAVTAA